ncbi:MAG: transcriptional regulator [Acidimicrobiia bacterium]|nr:helix-turn-helix domain-containing protein [bacterium]MXZ06484.1 transcriptional regulator [Acidimicrobiia bacterium]MCY3579552.1 helix-turn-helix domain-containing protein [bacterium]MCY3652814.1 helix-turn-helix domain-containing protein [bacterium]MDE0643583.1 helix-turn-helix domain-containing protein [bacterium]
MTVDHPLIKAVRPLVEAVGAEIVDPVGSENGCIPLEWEGKVVGAVRVLTLHDALDRLVTQVEAELGGKLAELGRVEKQVAVRLLDERGAFRLRKSINEVADLMEVSRITIYNYLNSIRGE